jgi:hypothetical protein
VIVNNQFLAPIDNAPVYSTLLQAIGSRLNAYSITQGEFYRVALAFKFYFNTILPKNSLNLISGYIKQSFIGTGQGK